MSITSLRALALAAIVFAIVAPPSAHALVVDNSQPPTDAFCSGACGVGSSVGFSRTVAQLSADEFTTFTDVWNISLSEAVDISGILFANNTLETFRLIDLNVGLEDGGVPVDPVGGYTVPNPPPFNTQLQTAVVFANLAPGDYQFVVTGIVPFGQAGGQYEFQGELSEVPLPAAGWLFVTALLTLLGLVRARRKGALSA